MPAAMKHFYTMIISTLLKVVAFNTVGCQTIDVTTNIALPWSGLRPLVNCRALADALHRWSVAGLGLVIMLASGAQGPDYNRARESSLAVTCHRAPTP